MFRVMSFRSMQIIRVRLGCSQIIVMCFISVILIDEGLARTRSGLI